MLSVTNSHDSLIFCSLFALALLTHLKYSILESWLVTLNSSAINNHVYRSQFMNYNHLLNPSMPLPNIYTELSGRTFTLSLTLHKILST